MRMRIVSLEYWEDDDALPVKGRFGMGKDLGGRITSSVLAIFCILRHVCNTPDLKPTEGSKLTHHVPCFWSPENYFGRPVNGIRLPFPLLCSGFDFWRQENVLEILLLVLLS